MKLRRLLACAGLLLLASSLSAAPAPTPPELPVETFFKKPLVTQLAFSPSGDAVALLHGRGGRMNIVVIDLSTMQARQLTAMERQDIASFQWVSNDRLTFSFDDEGNEFFGLYAIGRDGKNLRELSATGEAQVRAGKWNPRSLQPLALLKDDPDHILALSNERFLAYPDVYRVNLRNGRRTMVVDNPGNVTSWMADRDGVVRLGVASEHGKTSILYRDKPEAPWQVLERAETEDEGWTPLGFDGDNRTLFVASSAGRATEAVYRYDTATRKMGELVFADETYDVSGLVYSRALRKVIGVSYSAEKPRVHWIDAAFAGYQQVVDAAFPDTVNFIREAAPDGKKLLVVTTSEREPGVYYLMDLEKKKIAELAVTRPWIDPEQMARMTPITYTARDGLTLHGYLTLPAGREPKNLPLVVNPHGGPYGLRDEWGFNPEVQFLANRGFAVLQINYRGSGGYGPGFQRAGYKRWAQEMQDDLTDGVRWAVAQGYADPKRVVIQGASYGGFAVMAGLAFTPELYCAGVNVAGAASLKMFLEDRADAPEVQRPVLARRWGDLKKDKAKLEATAPELHMEGVRAPVFMAYGENDPRVRIEHGRALERALKRAGKPHEFFVKKDEGHGFRKQENAIELYQRIDAFLKANVPH